MKYERSITNHKIGTYEEWLAARLDLLEAEKELTRRSDELAQRRQELPWVRIDKEYRFETDEGSASLADLFRGRSQLLVYHFVFGYGSRLTDERRGCTRCSLIADHFDGVIPHLNGHDITLVCESIAPLQELQDYKRQMGWRFPWVSSLGSDFRFDFGAAFTEEQQRNGADYNYRHVDKPGPQREGMSVFALQDGVVYHTYSTYDRGTEALMGTYRFLDLAPWGRNEDGLESWWRRHDEYQDSRNTSRADGDNRGRRSSMGRLGPADEWDGYGRCDPARLVRIFCHHVAGDDGGYDAARRGPAVLRHAHVMYPWR